MNPDSEILHQQLQERAVERRYGSNPDDFDNSPCVESLGMLQSLTSDLQKIHTKLKSELFLEILERVLKEISEFYVKEVICMNMFDDAGIEQLCADIKQGIIPIFKNSGNVALHPRCFNVLQETLSLLTLKRASAALLLESVGTPERNSAGQKTIVAKDDATEEMLREFKLTSLSRLQVGAILKRRSDLIDIL